VLTEGARKVYEYRGRRVGQGCTSDLPTLEQIIVATFADDTAITAIGDNNSESTQKLEMAITEVQRWTRKWRIKLNKTKSVHIDFTNQHIRNDNLHEDMDVATVDGVIKQYAQRHEQRLHRHINVEALQLLHNDGLVRRLQQTKPF
jgi:hypothetical protein